MQRMTIEGSRNSGKWLWECECGKDASGEAQEHPDRGPSPTFPLVSAVWHHKRAHGGEGLKLEFGYGYHKWITDWFGGTEYQTPSSRGPAWTRL